MKAGLTMGKSWFTFTIIPTRDQRRSIRQDAFEKNRMEEL